MPDGIIGGTLYQAPHCDDKVLHAPGQCDVCDAFPEAQQQRIANNVNFTGEGNPNKSQCPAEARRPVGVINKWYGNVPHTPDTLIVSPKQLEEYEKLFADKPTYKPVCTCISGRSRFCDVHREDD